MRVLLFQSVRELLFNVVKHAEVETAEVCLRRLDDHVKITVSDKGKGFDPQAAYPCEGKGGGFGLFSIRERLNLLGGTMEVDSAPGRGSRFTLCAPLISTAPAEEHVPATLAGVRISRAGPLEDSATGAACSTDRRIRVVLVDDHVVVRQGLSRLLREEPGIEVVAEASDGQTAVEMVRQFLPDVVTMDISMPGMDGIEATRIIHSELPGIKVFGLSMFEEEQRAKAMLEAGAVACLRKSGPIDELVAAVRACAEPRPAGEVE
jgi:CheY-like chemotaxis protein